MKKSLKISPVLLMLFLVGCDSMTHTEQNVLGGATIGAVGGALISGDVGGAAIGAGVGALGGYLYDSSAYGDN